MEGGESLRFRAPDGLALALVFLVAAAAATHFVAGQLALWPQNGLWSDEYHTIAQGDLGIPFAKRFAERILPDVNPPLYGTIYAVFGAPLGAPRAAFLTLNVIAIVLTIAYVAASGWRAGRPLTALLCSAAFIVSGPVIYYAPEGRTYALALCAVFAIAWTVSLVLERRAQGLLLPTLVSLGVLAALTHVFAALFAGSIAAGLVLEGWLTRRPPVVRSGLALGGAATAVFLLWYLTVRDSFAQYTWIEFSVAKVREAAWFVRTIAIGPAWMVAPIGAFVAWSAFRQSFRQHLRVNVVAGALFVLIPLAASLVTPMIVGRYWMIGAPALVVLIAMAMRSHVIDRGERADNVTPDQIAGAALGGVCLRGASVFGWQSARQFLSDKPVWRGVDVTAELLDDCDAGAIHVNANPELYAIASGRPEELFVDARSEETRPIDARSSQCAVVGWAEHLFRIIQRSSDRELLALLKIDGEPGADVRVLRDRFGFVVVRADVQMAGGR